MTFNNRGLAVREARGTTYDAHLQPGALVHFPMAAAAAAATNYQPLPSPAKHVVAVQPQAAPLQPPPPQYVPVTMVEQNGRQMLAAVQVSFIVLKKAADGLILFHFLTTDLPIEFVCPTEMVKLLKSWLKKSHKNKLIVYGIRKKMIF